MISSLRLGITLLILVSVIASTPSALAGDKAKSNKAETAFPPFKAGEFVPAGLGARQAKPDIPYPGAASARSIPKGKAVLAVLVDTDNRPVDFLVIAASEIVFGQTLLDYGPKLSYAAAKLKGTAIPARYTLGYEFVTGGMSMNVMDQANTIPGKIAGDKFAYAAHPENELDHELEITRMALPEVPAEYKVVGDKPVSVLVSFFVDESGKVRIPNVDSAADSVLIPGAIAAVSRWTFKPATVKGKPALAYAARIVRFMPITAPAQ